MPGAARDMMRSISKLIALYASGMHQGDSSVGGTNPHASGKTEPHSASNTRRVPSPMASTSAGQSPEAL